ncbi:ectonucleotide pyrophosphatase/phosphodiesterase family member 5 isoform X2 [Acyrthosiphon pisum]|uniref:Ectonucleotide pyrophosphatase/phosphodiesterase family member 5 n=1 Tax=Acyrthosiphon pisum TaxID=7029 RepID=A0A8R2F931_ACYPI|nr:ectonucleotide pyrophosphatase/phosphodiesterase family member 5 isoform X2 [Acyrthosiphon pisum]|eukprot:XP_008182049.1 PREDICTED: ectonucleotide pyrophosphatase/phosphodiesterase family member 5-like isoform X2 [Acyrthosiphon pisum]
MCRPVGAVAVKCLVAVFAAAVVGVAAVTRHPVTVVVSFDGFRPDYIKPNVTPHMAWFQKVSAAPPYMRSTFPTKTFVNHFTMATGMYSDKHGVLDNYMFDKHYDKMHYTYEQFHYDDAVVPIWIHNEINGDGRYSGVMMWPGSEFAYQNKYPTHIQKYNSSIPWTDRIDKIMSWIKDEKKPANLVYAYFEEPDHTAHLKASDSQETINQIVRADATLKYILDQIKHEKLENKINLIILSDHGMDTVTYNRMIHLNEYVSNTTYKSIMSGPNAFIHPNPNKFDEVYKNLSKVANTSRTFNVFKQDQLPDRWHMKNNTRLTDIIYLLAKPQYAFWDTYFEFILNGTTKEKFKIGAHGYDNAEPQMRAIFMASGPAFKKNYSAVQFDNVDLYPLISRIAGLTEPSRQIDGTIKGVEQLLSVGAAPTFTPPVLGKRKISEKRQKG